MRSAVQIQAVSECARHTGLAAVWAGKPNSDPVWAFANGVNAVISWAFVAGVPAPTRGPDVPGPAKGPEDARREHELTVLCLPEVSEVLRPYGKGIVARCAWLLGEREVIVYPGPVAA